MRAHRHFSVASLNKPTRFALLLLTVALASEVAAERAPVLEQIELPHDYYFREMYLPQLTTGPSSLSFSPDGRTLVYSMQGSLWRQSLGDDVAVQLTAGPGYDYQPDWSPDGNRVVFARYRRDAVELYLLDLATGAATALTTGGAVNVEPRWSPDGSRIAFVSTRGTGRFHIRIGSFTDGKFASLRLTPERRSKTSRYYYSAFDHALSPAWTPGGDALVFVANPEIAYGTGAIWRRSLDGNEPPSLVRKEETTWKARPDVAPDGRRVVYSSYLGRQWHQLWLTTIDGSAEPFPLSYGAFDITAARWSPDGKRIAYIANAAGNTEIRIQEFIGGRTVTLPVNERRYRGEMTALTLDVLDSNGEPVPARVAVVAADGRSYAPADSWMHADDGFDREKAAFETHYFHANGRAKLVLPPGAAKITVWRGLEHAIEQRLINAAAERENALAIRLAPLDLPDHWQAWVGGDVHVHMNYGGAYRNTPQRLVAQAAAEDLDVVFNLVVNKEQRIPDIAYFSAAPDPSSKEAVLLTHAQEFHTGLWGHLGLLGLQSHLLLPDYAAYPGTGAASPYPDNATVAALARRQGALVGYVHPFLSPPPDPAKDAGLANALPIDAALGLIDYYEVVGFADHRASAAVWYRLLNCGVRVAAAGGTDAMANFASLRGPVGMNRTYVRVASRGRDPASRRAAWLDGLAAGRSIATNAAILGLTVDGLGPGAELQLEAGSHELEFAGFLRSIVPVDHVELVHNGNVIRTFDLDERRRSADIAGSVTIDGSGWLLLRAWNDAAHPLVFDGYPYATTSPVYVSVGGQAMRSASDADYFLAWIARVREVAAEHADYNDASERTAILDTIGRAERVFEACR